MQLFNKFSYATLACLLGTKAFISSTRTQTEVKSGTNECVVGVHLGGGGSFILLVCRGATAPWRGLFFLGGGGSTTVRHGPPCHGCTTERATGEPYTAPQVRHRPRHGCHISTSPQILPWAMPHIAVTFTAPILLRSQIVCACFIFSSTECAMGAPWTVRRLL